MKKKTKPRKRLTAKTAAPITTHKPYQRARLRFASRDHRLELSVSVPSLAVYLVAAAAVVGIWRAAKRLRAVVVANTAWRASFNARRIGGASCN